MNPKETDAFRRPEMLFSELLQKYARGDICERSQPGVALHRALVIAVDALGGKLENPSPGSSDKVEHKGNGGKSATFKARVGPRNPPNSVKARVLTAGMDQFYSDDSLRVFWPLSDEHDVAPVKPGEHVYVMFEDEQMTHGLWVCRVPGHPGLNLALGSDSYKGADDGGLTGLWSDTSPSGKPSSKKFKTEAEASLTGLKGDRLKNIFG